MDRSCPRVNNWKTRRLSVVTRLRYATICRTGGPRDGRQYPIYRCVILWPRTVWRWENQLRTAVERTRRRRACVVCVCRFTWRRPRYIGAVRIRSRPKTLFLWPYAANTFVNGLSVVSKDDNAVVDCSVCTTATDDHISFEWPIVVRNVAFFDCEQNK